MEEVSLRHSAHDRLPTIVPHRVVYNDGWPLTIAPQHTMTNNTMTNTMTNNTNTNTNTNTHHIGDYSMMFSSPIAIARPTPTPRPTPTTTLTTVLRSSTSLGPTLTSVDAVIPTVIHNGYQPIARPDILLHILVGPQDDDTGSMSESLTPSPPYCLTSLSGMSVCPFESMCCVCVCVCVCNTISFSFVVP